MKKILLSAAALAACAFMSNAQDGAPLYITGDFAASNWDAAAPAEFTYADGQYTYSIEEVSMFKISSTSGDWDTFNAGCLQLAENPTDVGTFALVAGDQNIVMPWKGQWTLTVAGDLSTITIATTTAKPEGPTAIYLRGDMNGWGVEEAWQFESADGNTYTLNNVAIGAGVGFKVADADWSKVNYGSAVPLLIDEPTVLDYNGANIVIDYEGEDIASVDLTFVLDTHTLTITESNGSGINDITINMAPAVYYNLQGVRVDNPNAGVYIVKQGNKVSKVYVK